MQINPQNVLNPFIEGPGLAVTVSAGEILVAGQPTMVPTTVVVVSPNTTSYIYLTIATGLINLNTTGFPSTNVYPIAVVVSGAASIKTLIDSRPDIFIGITNAAGAVLLNPSAPQAISGYALSVQGLQLNLVSESSNYTALAIDNIVLVNAATGTVTVQIPNTLGAFYRIKKTDASGNPVIVQMVSGNLDGAANKSLTVQYQSVDVDGDGTNGWTFGASNGPRSETVTSYSSNSTVAVNGFSVFGTCTGGASGITITLPTAVGNSGLTIKLLKIDAGVGAITILNSASSYPPLVNQYQYVVFESNGSGWYVVGNN